MITVSLTHVTRVTVCASLVDSVHNESVTEKYATHDGTKIIGIVPHRSPTAVGGHSAVPRS